MCNAKLGNHLKIIKIIITIFREKAQGDFHSGLLSMEFGNAGFLDGRKTGKPSEKPFEKGENWHQPQLKYIQHQAGTKPEPHWWEASTFTTIPSLGLGTWLQTTLIWSIKTRHLSLWEFVHEAVLIIMHELWMLNEYCDNTFTCRSKQISVLNNIAIITFMPGFTVVTLWVYMSNTPNR